MRLHHALRLWSIGLRLALLACGWALALAACAPPWTSTAPPVPYFSVADVSLDSPTDGWAVGNWVTPNVHGTYPAIVPAMAHLQGGQWRLAPSSVTGAIGDQIYHLVRMRSPTDGWATSGGAIYHYDGQRWRMTTTIHSIHIADLRVFPSAVRADASSNAGANSGSDASAEVGWAVGDVGILQYTHGAWMDVTTSLPPRPSDWPASWDYPGLRSVAIVSPTDAWAMGDGGLIWRYDGSHWRMATSPYFPNRFYTSASVDGYTASAALLAHFDLYSHTFEALYAAQMLSPTLGWAVGGAVLAYASTNWGPAVVEQYQAGAWQVVHTVRGNVNQSQGQPTFSSLALTSAQDGWIGGAWVHLSGGSTGDAEVVGAPVYAPLLLHYHAGQWTFATAPNVGAIHALAMVSEEEGWAAADGGLLHYSDGQWRLAPVSPAAA